MCMKQTFISYCLYYRIENNLKMAKISPLSPTLLVQKNLSCYVDHLLTSCSALRWSAVFRFAVMDPLAGLFGKNGYVIEQVDIQQQPVQGLVWFAVPCPSIETIGCAERIKNMSQWNLIISMKHTWPSPVLHTCKSKYYTEFIAMVWKCLDTKILIEKGSYILAEFGNRMNWLRNTFSCRISHIISNLAEFIWTLKEWENKKRRRNWKWVVWFSLEIAILELIPPPPPSDLGAGDGRLLPL